MPVKINLKVGKNAMQVEVPDMKAAHHFGAVYGNLPTKCDACGSENIFLNFRCPKGHEYYSLGCECGAEANFGIHQNDKKSLFWKNEKMVKFAPGQGKSQPQSEPFGQDPGAQAPPQQDDTLPF